MGAVYLAEHPRIGRKVAVKFLAPQLGRDEAFSKRFLSEAQALVAVQHPNIIEIYDFGETEDGHYYYVMEFLQGRELGDLIADGGRMSPAEALPYARQICLALQAAHDRGVVHRDLKPSNVFVLDLPAPTIKMLDFGIAKLLASDCASTMTGMVMGTPAYMAPEQAAGLSDIIGPQSDIYSLGVLIYEILSGRRPFESSSQAMLLAMHLRDEPPPLSNFVPSAPPELVHLLQRCLAKEPHLRPASGLEVLGIYEQLVEAIAPGAMAPAGTAFLAAQVPPSGDGSAGPLPVATGPGGGGAPTVTLRPAAEPALEIEIDLDFDPVREAPIGVAATLAAGASGRRVAPVSAYAQTVARSSDTASEGPFELGRDSVAPQGVLPRATGAQPVLAPGRWGAASDHGGAGLQSPAFGPAATEAGADAVPHGPPEHAEAVAAHDAERSQEAEEELVSKLLDQIRRQGDFPALSDAISEINLKSSVTGNTSAKQLADSILKDFSLSSKLLRLVNSAYYERLGGRITTLSRAVVLLGFEQVRRDALSLTVFPKLKGQKNVGQLVDATVGSLMGAILAKKVAKSLHVERHEEAYVCGLLHNLGRNLILYYVPERYQRISEMMGSGLPEERAAVAELGLSFETLGKSVARRWRMSEMVVDAMHKVGEAKVDKPRNDPQRIAVAANFANELCDILGRVDPAAQQAAVAKLLERYDESVPLDMEQVTEMVQATVGAMREQSAELLEVDLGSCGLLQKVSDWAPLVAAEAPGPSELGELVFGSQPSAGPAALRAADAAERVNELQRTVASISQLLSAGRPAEEILGMVLQALHQQLRLSRVLFLAMTPDRKGLVIRAHLGEDCEGLAGLRFALGGEADAFSQAVFNCRDLIFRDLQAPEAAAALPNFAHHASTRQAAYAYPVVLFMRTAALLYADGRLLGPQELPYLDVLRNQAIGALRSVYRGPASAVRL